VVINILKDYQILATKGKQEKKYGDIRGRRFQSRYMSNDNCNCYEKFGHLQVECPKFMEDLRRLNEKTKKAEEHLFFKYD